MSFGELMSRSGEVIRAREKLGVGGKSAGFVLKSGGRRSRSEVEPRSPRLVQTQQPGWENKGTENRKKEGSSRPDGLDDGGVCQSIVSFREEPPAH